MSRYIDADAICKELQGKNAMLDYAIYLINRQPTADVVEVVRCKDCKWYDGNECFEQLGLVCARDDDFCSWAERRRI